MSSYGALERSDSRVRFEDLAGLEDIPVARSVDNLQVPRARRPIPVPSRSDAGLRRPYMFSRSRAASQLSLQSNQESLPPETYREQNMAIRYRLFNRLDPGGRHLIMPNHVIPSEFFSILPFDDFKDSEGKQGSIVTIFSLWNTMMGTSLLAMPWALQQAGLVLGILLMLLMAGIAFYTAYRVVQSPQSLAMNVDSAQSEFSDVCRYFFGKKGEFVSVFFSIIVLIGGVIVYFVLMSNFLYYTGNIVYESLQPNSTTLPIMANKTFTCDVYCPNEHKSDALQWLDETEQLLDAVKDLSSSTFDKFWQLQGSVPVYLAIATFPLLNFKSPTFFTKFNVLGTVSVMYLLCFTFSKAFECGWNMDFSDPTSEHYVQLYSWKFPSLTGTLALSYFIHNAVLTILRNQKHPENNARDLGIGYALSAACYILIGFMFFAAFPTVRSCISDNFLNNFGSGDVMSATARLFLLFQMITVMPLLMYLIRVQFSYVFTGTVYPGFIYVCLINVLVIVVAVFFAVMFPHVGSILRYVGSVSGLVYIFTLPCIVHLKRLEVQGRLTRTQLAIHGSIVVLGVLNLIAQFLV